MELRFQGTKLSANKDDSLTVSGYVNKTGQLSEVLGSTKNSLKKLLKVLLPRLLRMQKKSTFLQSMIQKNLIFYSK